MNKNSAKLPARIYNRMVRTLNDYLFTEEAPQVVYTLLITDYERIFNDGVVRDYSLRNHYEYFYGSLVKAMIGSVFWDRWMGIPPYAYKQNFYRESVINETGISEIRHYHPKLYINFDKMLKQLLKDPERYKKMKDFSKDFVNFLNYYKNQGLVVGYKIVNGFDLFVRRRYPVIINLNTSDKKGLSEFKNWLKQHNLTYKKGFDIHISKINDVSYNIMEIIKSYSQYLAELVVDILRRDPKKDLFKAYEEAENSEEIRQILRKLF